MHTMHMGIAGIPGIAELVTFCNIVASLVMFCAYLCISVHATNGFAPDAWYSHMPLVQVQGSVDSSVRMFFTLCLFAKCSLAPFAKTWPKVCYKWLASSEPRVRATQVLMKFDEMNEIWLYLEILGVLELGFSEWDTALDGHCHRASPFRT